MVYQPVEELLPKADNSVYLLTTLASWRAQELAAGQPKLVETAANEKLATISLLEIRAGRVVSKNYAELMAKTAK